MKLYTRPASFRTQKVIITSEYCNLPLEICTDFDDQVIQKVEPISKLPLLEISSQNGGKIAESNAICRYLCKISKNSKVNLLGKTAFEAAEVDSWLDFCSNELEVPMTVLTYPIIGWMPNHVEAAARARKDIMNCLQILEKFLKTRTYLVGEDITLADIAMSTALILPYKLILDDKIRKSFTCVTRWFTTCVNQKEFMRVVGEVDLCKTEMTALAGTGASGEKTEVKQQNEKKTKKEKKKKEVQKEVKPKGKEADAEPDEAEEEPPKKEEKPKHYTDLLPKSSFVLDEWKRTYSNAPGGDCYKTMDWFWSNVDPSGYSLYSCDYKYNSELSVGFMVSNLAGGFIQRCDDIRKLAFGVLQILQPEGGENKFEIKGCWLFRGDSEKLMLEANDDAEGYTWQKIDIVGISDEKKKWVADMWCAEEEIDGVKIFDAKVFK